MRLAPNVAADEERGLLGMSGNEIDPGQKGATRLTVVPKEQKQQTQRLRPGLY